jgi:uncharacterized protein (TIGR02246 family)
MKKLLWLPAVLGLVTLFTITRPAEVQGYADDQNQIMAVEHQLADGFKAKDVNRIMSCYVPDESLLVFDVVPPRQYTGAKAYRKDWEDLFAAFPGPAEVDISDLNASADRNLGYAHLMTHSVLTDKDGKKLETDIRTTDVFRKTGGKWLIVHEHNSVPVDLASGKADLMSKP